MSETLPLTLVAVQAKLEPSGYESDAAFRRWVLGLSEEALAGRGSGPALVAFPEAIGLPLLFMGARPGARTALRAALGLARNGWRGALAAGARRPWGGALELLAPRAEAVYQTYRSAFSEAARAFGVTVVAGSALLPEYDKEGLRGLHRVGPWCNQSLSFSPTGTLLNASRKLHLTPGLESRLGLRRGRLAEARPFVTPFGAVGVAVCLDAFFDSVASHYDGAGARILVQPSANFAPWDRVWPGDPALSEGEAWFRHGLVAQLQGRQNLVYGVNPMLVGAFYELEAQGRSSLSVNRCYLPDAGVPVQPGVLALAASATEQSFVRATVPWPAAPAVKRSPVGDEG